MAVLNPKLEAIFAMSANVSAQTRVEFNTAQSDLRRWRVISVQTGDAPSRDGHGHVPDHWIRCTPFLSATGEYVDGLRPNPGDIPTDADIQWIADPSSWDITTNTWGPWRSGLNDFTWVSTTLNSPVIEPITYRMGKEVITVNRMHFTGDQYLASDFQNGVADAIFFTISMVVMLEASNGTYALLDWGIPGWTNQPAIETRTSISVSDVFNFRWRNAAGIVDPVVPVTRYRPAFITMVVAPPTVKMVVSMGPNFTFRSVATDNSGPLASQLQFFLGRSTDATMVEGDFSVMELSIWGRALSDRDIIALNGSYASVYGASSEW